MQDVLAEEYEERLLRACRAALGDELRSLTYFTPDASEHIYLREDLERGEDPLAYVMNEQHGFEEQQTYEWSELGDYRFTVRAFANGHIVRVIVGDHGAYATTDATEMSRFAELAESMGAILEELNE